MFTLHGLHPRESAVLAVVVLACWYDLRTRRLPNPLTLGGAAVALLHAAYITGAGGAVASISGWAVGLLLFLPFFALGGLGAGDVKLLAAVGAWLGPGPALWVALYAAMAGGVMAVVVGLATGYLGQALKNVSFLMTFWQTVGLKPAPELTLAGARGPRLPYALAIAAGTAAQLWLG